MAQTQGTPFGYNLRSEYLVTVLVSQVFSNSDGPGGSQHPSRTYTPLWFGVQGGAHGDAGSGLGGSPKGGWILPVRPTYQVLGMAVNILIKNIGCEGASDLGRFKYSS